jgi:hypothetical protein
MLELTFSNGGRKILPSLIKEITNNKQSLNFIEGTKMKIETILITLSIIGAGVGAYVLLHGHWATPITEWFVMH